MATVTFTRLYLNPLTDLTSGYSFRLSDITKSPQTPGETRQYGTRLRSVATGVTAQQWAVTVFCDLRDQVDFLTAQQGLVVCARDPRGDKIYAVYRDLQLPEQRSPNLRLQVPLTLNEVTVSETV